MKACNDRRMTVTPDGEFVVCLECEEGRLLKSLRRHLAAEHDGMTPEAYRAKHGLAPNTPMHAPNYARMRRALARPSGFGIQVSRKPRA